MSCSREGGRNCEIVGGTERGIKRDKDRKVSSRDIGGNIFRSGNENVLSTCSGSDLE